MKNSLRFYSVFFIVIIAFALDGCAPKDKKVDTEEPPVIYNLDGSVTVPRNKILVPNGKHTVVLLVDTENLEPGIDVDARDKCSFPDLNPGESSKNYTTDVLAGDSIFWLGVSTSAPHEDIITITEIEHIGGQNVIVTHQLEKGKFVGLIEGKKGDLEIYKIKYSIINKEGEEAGTYELDPKIRVH
jgi:hypothetical protein